MPISGWCSAHAEDAEGLDHESFRHTLEPGTAIRPRGTNVKTRIGIVRIITHEVGKGALMSDSLSA